MLPSGRPQTCHFLGMIPGPRRTGGASVATETREKGEIFYLEWSVRTAEAGEGNEKENWSGAGAEFLLL